MKRFGPLLIATLAATPALSQQVQIALTITLDPATVAELTRRGEAVVVSSWFYGDPSPTNTQPVNEIGTVDLGNETATITPLPEQTIHVGGSLQLASFSNVLAPQLNVNVYSARLTDENNLLDCTLVELPLKDATTPQTITCKLLPPA